MDKGLDSLVWSRQNAEELSFGDKFFDAYTIAFGIRNVTRIDAALAEATLQRPALGGYISEGKQGIHSEHLGFLLAEMQSLARAYPNGVW